MNAQDQFIERHKDSDFPHKEELFAALYSGDCVLDQTTEGRHNPAPCSQLLDIYRFRAGRLRRFDTPHARRLGEDTLALCEELEKTPDERCHA